MARMTRNTPKNFGGSYSYTEEMESEGKRPGKFFIKEKVKEMIKYGMPLVMGFSRRNRQLGDTLKESMLEMLRLSIKLEKKHFKKSPIDDLDIELAMLKEFVSLAADKDFFGDKYPPALTIHQREIWNRHNLEIGRLIGGYKNWLDNNKEE